MTLIEQRDALGRWAAGNRAWTRESAIEAVQAFAAREGFQPVMREAGVHNRIPNADTATRLFGSWNEMIRAAGFEPYPARSSYKAKQLARRDRLNKTDGFSATAINGG